MQIFWTYDIIYIYISMYVPVTSTHDSVVAMMRMLSPVTIVHEMDSIVIVAVIVVRERKSNMI